MSKQLKVGDILDVVYDLKEKGMTDKEIDDLQIYIGDDDELNGIHTAWCVDVVDVNDETYVNLIDMINGYPHNLKFKDKAILIS